MNAVTKRITVFVVALFLIAYVGYQAFLYFFSSSVEFETVNSYTVYDRLEVQGVAIRSEQILEQSSSGYVYYTLENGARVSKDGTIAQVFPSESDALAKKDIETVNHEIEVLETLQKQGSVSKTNLEMLNTQLGSAQRDLVTMARKGDFSDMDTVSSNMLELFNRKQILVGHVDNFDARLSALKTKRDKLAGYKDATGTITSPVTGYFVSSLDGYENTFDYDNVTSLTVDDVQKALDAKPKPDTTSVGKVVGNYEWYLACIVPNEKLSLFGEKMNMNVMLPFVTDDAVPVRVEKINRAGDKAMVLLKCSYMSEALSGVRCEQIQILLKEYTGLYVPDEALRFNKDNEPGVFVRNGTTLQFRKVKIDYHSETGKYSICDANVETAKLESAPVTKTTQPTTADGEAPPEDAEPTEPPVTKTTVAKQEEKEDYTPYLKLYDDMVVGGKNLYEGKVVH